MSSDFTPVVIMAKERPTPLKFPEFGAYKAIYTIGDSTMNQFTAHGVNLRNNVYYGRRGTNWGRYILKPDKFPLYIDMIHSVIQDRNIAHEKGNNTALIFGSGIWDIIDNNLQEQPNFNDHLNALETLIKTVQNITDAKIYWKSMTAMQIHVVVNPAGFDRAKYMSNSRAKWLHDEQKELMQKLDIPVLDMFDTTNDHEDMTMEGDGRYYNADLQLYFINYFYPIEQD